MNILAVATQVKMITAKKTFRGVIAFASKDPSVAFVRWGNDTRATQVNAVNLVVVK